MSKTEAPFFSIITITLNSVKTLNRTIESVNEQSFQDFEYIIVDGSSTDGTLEIIKSHADEITKWISEPDDGISSAFNKGIDLARGEYIIFVNSDDWLELNALEIAYNSLSLNKTDILYGQLKYWDGDELINVKSGNHRSLLNGLRGMTIPHPCCFVSRKLFSEIGNFNTSYTYAMDYQFFLRASKYEASFQKIDIPISNFSSGGMTSSGRLKGLLEERRAKNSVLKMKPFKANAQFVIKLLFIYLLGPILHYLKLDRFK